MTCSKCGRTLKNPSRNGMGPKCARAAYGVKPKRRQRAQQPVDAKQPDLFAEVQP